jgi:ketosteroid isomerase-like protein
VQPAPMMPGSNEELITRIFGALAEGDARPFLDSLAADVRWTITGTSSWSRTYDGKGEVQAELLAPLFAKFDGLYTNEARRVIGAGEHVIVEARGHAITKTGLPYENSYCWIFRLEGGEISEITEYCDSLLFADVLGDPGEPPIQPRTG